MSSSSELYERVLLLGFLDEVYHTSEIRPRATNDSNPWNYQKLKNYTTPNKYIQLFFNEINLIVRL